jgi:hypothetical protein
MLAIRRWEGESNLQFDVEWTFYYDIESKLRVLAVEVVRVTLTNDHKGFNVTKLNIKPIDIEGTSRKDPNCRRKLRAVQSNYTTVRRQMTCLCGIASD